MTIVTDLAMLEGLYGTPAEASIVKVADRVTPLYRKLIEASPFVALATVGPDGLDCSPRGDPDQALYIADPKTLHMPDRRGNNRMDSLRNIVADPRVALMFVIPGSNTTLRMNGTAKISVDPALLETYAVDGKAPRSVIVFTVNELYFQCARAVMRAGLWDTAKHVDTAELPTPGELMKEMTSGVFDGETYDRQWPGRAAKTMW